MKENEISYTGCWVDIPREMTKSMVTEQNAGHWFLRYTPQNNPTTLRPCITTPQPAIRLTSHNMAKIRMGTSNSSVLCRNGRAL